MSINLAIGQSFLNQCVNIPQGMDISTYVKTCFFIYDQNPDTCTIRIEDKSEQISFYDADTDVHEVFVTITNDSDLVCYTNNMVPFGTLSFDLPECGMYTVEITVQYTIQYEISPGVFEPHTFQISYIYPIECIASTDYFNNLLKDIDCKIVLKQCAIQKRKCVGRDYDNLQSDVYALDNYRYLLCNFNLSAHEIDCISCAVTKIKKAC